MKLIDKNTGKTVLEIMTNHSMTVDEMLNFYGITIDEEGQLIDEDGAQMGAWYEDLEIEA